MASVSYGWLRQEYRAFCDAIIRVRKENDLTQEDVAKRLSDCGLSFSQSDVSKIERGERRIDAVEFIFFARALGCDPSEIWRAIEKSFSTGRRKQRGG